MKIIIKNGNIKFQTKIYSISVVKNVYCESNGHVQSLGNDVKWVFWCYKNESTTDMTLRVICHGNNFGNKPLILESTKLPELNDWLNILYTAPQSESVDTTVSIAPEHYAVIQRYGTDGDTLPVISINGNDVELPTS